MLVLYVAHFAPGGTCEMRRSALEELGCRTVSLDTNRLDASASRLGAGMSLRFQRGGVVAKLNRELVGIAGKEKPDIVWIDKGMLIRRETLDRIRGENGPALVHYNPDDPFGHHSWGTGLVWRTFIKAIPAYDVHFVPREENLEEYRAKGAEKVIRFHRGYDPSVHRKLPEGEWRREPYESEVCFPGAREREREERLGLLVEKGVPLTIWGRTWKGGRSLGRLSGRCVLRTPVGEEYARVINGSKICLNFLRQANRDRENSRTFEIAACGTFLLGERNEEQTAVFEEGKEAEFFSSGEELVEKAGFYLKHEAARRRIAAAGHARCASSAYSYRDRIREMLKEVREQL